MLNVVITTGGSGALGNEQERKNEQCDHVHTPVCCTPVEAAAAPSLNRGSFRPSAPVGTRACTCSDK